MYNRYVPSANGYTRIQEDDTPVQPTVPEHFSFQPVPDETFFPTIPSQPSTETHLPSDTNTEPVNSASAKQYDVDTSTPNTQTTEDAPPSKGWSDLIGDFKASSWLTDLLSTFKLDSIDSGDILLLLILLFIFIEGDDLELVITLGLLLLFGLAKKDTED